MVSKEVARDLRKYKFNIGKTPNKENRRAVSAEKRDVSPTTRRLNFGSPNAPPGERSPRGKSINSRELRDLMKELDGGIHDKVSLLKMLAVKCTDADTSYKKIRHHLIKGDVTQAEK